jgi:ribosomal protein S18 acetylase RimI-like enzyme
MIDARFVPYDDETHRAQFLELNIEYVKWVVNEVNSRYGINLVPPGSDVDDAVREHVKGQLPGYASIKPPEGIIYILEVDGEAAGMGALRKMEDGIGEIKRMYNRPKYREIGYGKEMFKLLEEKAKEFGYSRLRLDTRTDSAASLHIYRKAGFKEIGPYPGVELAALNESEGIMVYMEKIL